MSRAGQPLAPLSPPSAPPGALLRLRPESVRRSTGLSASMAPLASGKARLRRLRATAPSGPACLYGLVVCHGRASRLRVGPVFLSTSTAQMWADSGLTAPMCLARLLVGSESTLKRPPSSKASEALRCSLPWLMLLP